MASKTKAATKEKEKEEAPEKEAAETPDAPLPLLDLSDAAVKKLIRSAKKRGYVTHDRGAKDRVLPSEEVNSEQIEDVLAMFSEMGVNVVETEEATEEGEEQREEAEEEPENPRVASWFEEVRRRSSRPRPRPRSRPSAPTTPCACICGKWARWSCSPARARSRSPSASRPAVRR